MNKGERIREIKCPICGKRFISAPMHIYKRPIQRTLVCSYSCMLADERAVEEKKQKQKKTKQPKEE